MKKKREGRIKRFTKRQIAAYKGLANSKKTHPGIRTAALWMLYLGTRDQMYRDAYVKARYDQAITEDEFEESHDRA